MFSREFGKKMPSHGQYLLKQQKAKVCRLLYHCMFAQKPSLMVEELAQRKLDA